MSSIKIPIVPQAKPLRCCIMSRIQAKHRLPYIVRICSVWYVYIYIYMHMGGSHLLLSQEIGKREPNIYTGATLLWGTEGEYSQVFDYRPTIRPEVDWSSNKSSTTWLINQQIAQYLTYQALYTHVREIFFSHMLLERFFFVISYRTRLLHPLTGSAYRIRLPHPFTASVYSIRLPHSFPAFVYRLGSTHPFTASQGTHSLTASVCRIRLRHPFKASVYRLTHPFKASVYRIV